MIGRFTVLITVILASTFMLVPDRVDSAGQTCLGWERSMRSAAADAFGVEAGRPAIDHFTDGQSFGRVLNDWVADNCMRLNNVQVLGTHNSYHVEPRPPLLAFLMGIDPSAAALEYSQRPLTEQLDVLGVRQVELDVYADPAPGGRFAMPLGQLVFPNNPPMDPIKPALLQPGLKVLHIPDIDFESTCLTFVSCLQELEDWSDANPGHLPIMVQVEAKDEALPIPPGYLPPGLPPPAVPVPFGAAELNSIDTEIRSVFSEDDLITPDEVRGARPTLEEAVRVDGWPTLNESRGKFLFTLDNEDAKRTNYIAGHPSLQGRVMFTSSAPGNAEAAFVKVNEPVPNQAYISQLVQAGYIVRTRADEDTFEARTGLTFRRDAALASGAQFVSTDYPEDDPDFPPDYFVDIPGADVARCNPVLAPPGCNPAALEN